MNKYLIGAVAGFVLLVFLKKKGYAVPLVDPVLQPIYNNGGQVATIGQ